MLLHNSGFTPDAQKAYLASIGDPTGDPRKHDLCEGRGNEAVSNQRADVSGYTFDLVQPSEVHAAVEKRRLAGAAVRS